MLTSGTTYVYIFGAPVICMVESFESPDKPAEPPLQFGLRTVLIAQAVCAVFLALLSSPRCLRGC